MRDGSGNPSEQDNALFVGDWSDRIDEFCGGFLAEKADEERANFASSHAPESASSRPSDRRMEIIEKIAQQRNHFPPSAGAPARSRTNLRVVMPQELQRRGGGECGVKPCGGGDRFLQTRALNHDFGDQANERLGCIGAADGSQGIERSGLLGHDPISAKTGEAPAQGFEDGDRGSQAASSRFGSQGCAVAYAGIGKRGD